MELLTLSTTLRPVKYLNYINLQWTRRYYSVGEFAAQIPASEYDNTMAYIFTKDRKELGVIQSVRLNCTSTGDFIMISGFFYEFVLNDKIIYPRYRKSGTPEVIARDVVVNFMEDIPLVLGTLADIGTSTSMQSTGDEIGKRLFALLKTQEQSYHCRYDWDNQTIKFEVWQGKDRTQEQTVNPWVTFSDGFRNMGDVAAIIDASNYKNYAIICGNGAYEEGNQIVVAVDQSAGEHKQKIYIDKTSMMYDADTQTLDDYKQQLSQAGAEELNKYSMVNTVDFEPDASRLKYMVDYDLGDKCDVIIEKIGRAYKTRITEIYEVYKEGQHTIKLTFGEVTPTIYQKARLH